jgi:phosphohistidine phosphatase SixA
VIILVPHADAGSASAWGGADRVRPLSYQGNREALDLADVLTALDPGHLLTSPFLRCRQTLEPLAARLGLPIEDHPLLLPDVEPRALADLLVMLADSTSALATDRETLERLFDCSMIGSPTCRISAPPLVPPPGL